MKPNIHPTLHELNITCVCGAVIPTLCTLPALTVEICSKCHPFFTGKQRLMDTEGRIDRFMKKYGKGKAAAPAEAKK